MTADPSDLRHHNQPPLPERLALDYAEVVSGVEALAFRANSIPQELPDEAAVLAAGDIGAEAARFIKHADAERAKEKAPYLRACREVDSFFATPIERATQIRAAMVNRVTAFNIAKAARERAARMEAERIARDEAEALRKEAEKAAAAGRVEDAMADIEDARRAEAQAREAAAHAAAPAADLTRTRSEAGTLVTTRTEWTFEIDDIDAVPLDKLRPYIKRDVIEQAVRAFIKQGHRQLHGVRIFQREVAQFR